MPFKVFISYSSKDLQDVEQLKQHIVETPIEVFIAEHSVLPGEGLTKTIAQAIDECDLFIVLWSKNAKASEWVSQEIGRAHSLNKRILPLVLTEDTKLPGFITDLKYLPIYKNEKAALAEARALIIKLYENKLEIKQKQKSNNTLALIGFGALLLWAFIQE